MYRNDRSQVTHPADPNNPNTSPYAGCCTSSSAGGHTEEISIKLEATGDGDISTADWGVASACGVGDAAS